VFKTNKGHGRTRFDKGQTNKEVLTITVMNKAKIAGSAMWPSHSSTENALALFNCLL